MAGWTLETELCKLTRCDSVEGALRELSILGNGERIASLHYTDWRRGGNETYICPFELATESGARRSLMLKAHVPFPGPRSVPESLDEMIRRRHLLAKHGANTPRLYYAGDGVVIEEFVPYALAERWGGMSSAPETLQSVTVQLFRLAFCLDELGFAPIGVFDDLRLDHSQRVHVIDFGQDLGPPFVRPNRALNEQALLSWLPKECQDFTERARATAVAQHVG